MTCSMKYPPGLLGSSPAGPPGVPVPVAMKSSTPRRSATRSVGLCSRHVASLVTWLPHTRSSGVPNMSWKTLKPTPDAGSTYRVSTAPEKVAGAVEEVEDRVPDACRRIARRQQDADGAVGHDEARGHRHGDVEAAWCVADRGRTRGGAEDERGDHPRDDVPVRALLHRLAPMPCAVSGSIR